MPLKDLTALVAALLLPAALAAATGPAAEIYSRLPEHDVVRLSPDGRRVAARFDVDGKYLLIVYDLAAVGTKPPLTANPDTMEVSWLHWKNPERLLVGMQFSGLRTSWLKVHPSIETRLYGMDPDGNNRLFLVPPAKGKDTVQLADRVVSFLPADPDHILMAFNPYEQRLPRLYRVNVNTARRKAVEYGHANVTWWIADQQGNARIGIGYDEDGAVTQYLMRKVGSDSWDAAIRRPVDQRTTFAPQFFNAEDPDLLYVLSDHDGDTTGLYEFRVSTQSFVRELFRHPQVDVSRVLRDPGETRLVGVEYVTDVVRTHWLDERVGATMAAIAARVGGGGILRLVSASTDYGRIMVYAEPAGKPPRYLLYDAGTRELRTFAYVYPGLESQPVATTRAVSFAARDGLEIPGYLTLPPGTPERPPAPLATVIMPRGGDEGREVGGFDPMVQMLAARGYAVLQVNYRGSAGFGRQYRVAGDRAWGQAIQDDVTDGTAWLVGRGIADRRRICIMGHAFGGYSALMGAVREPELYTCAISIDGVTDLRRLAEERSYYLNRKIQMARIGQSWRDRASLDANSPVSRASDIRIPVLLAHAQQNRIFRPAHTAAMLKALKDANRTVEHVALENSDHLLRNGPDRSRLFRAVDDFLKTSLAATATAGGGP